MLVIHGIWARGALCLWAEDSSRPATSAEPSGRPSRAPRPHPFAADPETIAAALAPLGSVPGAAAQQAAADELTLWLPSAPDSPQAAPELIRPAGQEGAKARTRWAALGCWRVPALAVEPAVALGVLAALDRLAAPGEARPAAEQLALPAEVPGPGESVASAGKPPPGRTSAAGERPALGDPVALMDSSLTGEPVSGEPLAPGELVPGGSAVYWAAVGWFAADLAERGRVLPALARASSSNGDGDRWVARWRPVLTGHDPRRAGELADAMPPLCRAAEPGGESPGPILAAALNELADAAARVRLAAARPGWTVLPPRSGRRPARIPVAERWLAALTGPSGEVTVSSAEDKTEAAELAAGLAAWRDAAQAPAGPVRTCFRLVEPEPAELNGEAAESSAQPAEVTSEAAEHSPAASESVPGPESLSDHVGSAADQAVADHSWRVQFALQSTEDPSLMLDAADVWAGTGGWAPGGIQHPDEELLAGLGAAARLFGELDGALRTPAPDEVRLDTAGAFRFLTETAPLLAGAGFGVLLPDWARKARLGLKLTSRSRSTSAGADGSVGSGAGLSLADLVQFRYDLALGDDTLHPDELAELARLKIPLVRIRGQWVELDERNLQAALKFLEGGRQGVLPAGEVLLEGLRGPEEDLPVTAIDADGWLADLLSGQAEHTLAPVTTPETFHGKLRPYQERGLAWLSFLSNLSLGGILADDMGTGKSPTTLSLLTYEKETNKKAGPTLLVCPMSLVGNWQKEAERFTPDLSVYVHHGSDRLSGAELQAALGQADLVLTTYAIAARDRDDLAAVSWQRIVCDEAQNIKNAATQQARAVRSLPAATRIALTGTPVENRLGELWSIMEFTSPGLLGPAEKFRTSFAVPVERHGDEEATTRLKRLTGPFILRRLKTDRSIISDLPDKIEMKMWCNLTAEQASLYQATVTDMLRRIEAAEEDIERRGLVLATMAKLKQVCNHPAHLLGDGSRLPGRSGKLARLEEIGDEIIAAGDKALIFTQYAEFGRLLQPYLAARLGCPVFYLHGGTPKKARDAMVADFQAITDPALFLLSLKAGGTGLNLTGANHVIHFDRWWNPAVEDQATDRAFRIGQRKDVQVRKFVCVGTVEERIDAMIEEKKALAERIVGTGEGWLTGLSTADLRDVLALSPEAVSQ
jgi:SNF2 family DNA or RNA helicase